ncbi:NPCBM/NEW2 domain-containing protein [Shewanella sp. A25]|nr:NPCBM/NEW2 domain-containing protein [Shewanella shenzhenensis]
MKFLLKKMLVATSFAIVASGCSHTEPTTLTTSAAVANHKQWALTPPLGWNSWDYYGTSITEQQAKAQANAMAKYLKPAGYDVFTVDIQWYEPGGSSHYYDANAVLSMDQYGRLTPAVNRFPSAKNDQGFSSLAQYVHEKGLRFGIHIMRGIPKQAVHQNTPVLGTQLRARDIAVTSSVCPWNPDMYGVDATKPEGQAYYDSIIQMYADWGVDFIKVDDISRPYDDVQRAEIEAIRRAIDKTGRPIILSLSPGATPLTAGEHVEQHANMWRITDDFWDRWGALREMFERTHAWEPYRSTGAWPDADMLPIGLVEFGRPTKFTKDEHYSLMSLWSIAKSPLIFGGDMTRMDDFTLAMLTNPEMLAVNQHSINNRQVSRIDNLIVWSADVPNSQDKYVALFNAQSKDDAFELANADYASPVIAGLGKSQEIAVNIKGGKKLVLMVKDGGDGVMFDHAAWINPTLTGAKGSLSLKELTWSYADSGWKDVRWDNTMEDAPLMDNGKQVSGIATHSNSTIIYDIPEGYDTFTTKGMLTHTGSVVFGVLVDRSQDSIADTSTVTVNFNDIGIEGKAKVRDLWKHQDLGTFNGSFGQALPLHGGGLYRITPLN